MPARTAALFGVLTVLLAGCGHHARRTTEPGGATAAATVSTAAPGPPQLLLAKRMPPAYVRFPVPSADLTNLVRVRGATIAALVDRGAFAGEVYPAISTNDGASWTIDGPRFSSARTGSHNAVRSLAAMRNGTTIAWAPAGDVVRAKPLRSSRWYITRFDGDAGHLTVAGGTLVVSLSDPPARYVSGNGLLWTLRST